MKKAKGFTLLELMIVVAIITLIAAIALPSFFEQIRKSRRADAKQGLADVQLKQERYRSNHSTYATTAQVTLPTSENYTFAVTDATVSGTDVLMTATPQNAQSGDRCGTYSLRIDNNNNDAPVGTIDRTTSTGAADCW